ncbi:hypothetical protein L2E82_13107 [Cichorium intybus]|uniref:Uncharacterized protein n=1 Tax=Cichorium intybus TaxID=13427 RepID=A0ACB9GHX3_CICIN|nr:hypothetical protein L2E82_13107 [Cichorium intybus]
MIVKNLLSTYHPAINKFTTSYGFLASVMDKKSLWSEGHASKSNRTDEKEREQNAAKEDKYKEKYWAKSIQELDLSDNKNSKETCPLLLVYYSG